MKTVIIALAAMIALTSCTTELKDVVENRAPVLVRTVTDVSTKVNTPIAILMRYVEAYDEDGDRMSVIVGEGVNYTIAGNVVTPAKDFIGDLSVPVIISDGKLQSEQKILIVSVVTSVELLPLLNGSWWEYRDFVVANDSMFTTRMSATWSRDTLIGSNMARVFTLRWTNLADLGIQYESYNDSLGVVLLGGKSPHDTIISPQRLYQYPIVKGSSWDYSTLRYNVTDSIFYLGESAKITCTETSVFVTVPAGIFECIEMTLSYIQNRGRSFSGVIVSPMGIKTRATGSVIEKLYYSPGVGYVKNITSVNGETAWVKELVRYKVKEEK